MAVTNRKTARQDGQGPIGGSYPVLVVDDDEEVLNVIARQLAPRNWTVIPTPSPAEALHLLRTREIGVLLCDMNMPDLGGNEVLRAAREANPDIISVVLSGRADRDDLVRAVNEGGIWKFMDKPWRRDELLSVVEEALARYSRLRHPQAQLGNLARTVTRHRAKAGNTRKPSLVVVRGSMDGAASARDRLRRLRPHRATRTFESNRYRLAELIGRGRTGEVYRAEDTMLNMTVAVKLLSKDLVGNAEEVRILKEEARIAMQLSHRHIVRLHNFRRLGDRYFLVMEFVDGCTFHELIKEHGTLPLNTVVQVASVAADALGYAHRHGVLHKDIKPSNLMLASDGVLKIIDFGVACLMHRQPRPGQIMGTPAYMSPEQLRGHPLDERTDVYSLAAVLYELLTGRPPIPANMPIEVIPSALPPSMSHVPEAVREVISVALAPEPAHRYPGVAAFENDLVQAAGKGEE